MDRHPSFFGNFGSANDKGRYQPAQQTAMLRKIKVQMKRQVDLMETIVGEDVDFDGDDNFFDETYVFKTLVPPRINEKIREAWPEIRKNLKDLGIDAILDLVENNMIAKSTPEMDRRMDILRARDLLMLLARGFPHKQALLVLKTEFNCDFIKIGGNIATKEEFVRRRNRLIGPKGHTLKAIELLTECYILVYGNTVCVVGKGHQGINTAGEIILDCMNRVNPISHIRRLVIMKELEKDPNIKKEDWTRFLPPVRKNAEVQGFNKQNPRLIDFLLDDPSEMTASRRIALSLMKYSWYNVPVPKEEQEGEEKKKTKIKG